LDDVVVVGFLLRCAVLCVTQFDTKHSAAQIAKSASVCRLRDSLAPALVTNYYYCDYFDAHTRVVIIFARQITRLSGRLAVRGQVVKLYGYVINQGSKLFFLRT
jgi:hypothetical protein